MKKVTKDVIIGMRFTQEEKELIRKISEQHNMSIGMFIRVHFLNKVLKKL